MIRFNNDYSRGCHPSILQALTEINSVSYAGYGEDEWCRGAAQEIGKYLDCPQAAVHFIPGGTQVNVLALAAALRPYQAVLCADTAHINVHESGAPERAGIKLVTCPGREGKLDPAFITEQMEIYRTSTHQDQIAEPKLVSLAFPTEYGTIYSLSELEAIHALCQRYGLYLYIDGARLGYGLGAAENDVTMADLARLADIFTIGGTKCGAMFGEALVITNPALNVGFRHYMKQGGAMLAKGWLLGVQFYTLFRDGLYFEITRRADQYAMELKSAFAQKGVSCYIESCTNQLFLVVEDSQARRLAEKYIFEQYERVDDTHQCVRFCTSWSTDPQDVAALCRDIGLML
ncbi:MAG: aminotransferase class I/II-fold pyridoxal phosphate-dependent enzyme [Oscillospiraceae bacterium]|nr:aminotransferase class I/II-fold pyridoxal phosphate-dependent enzyme [Oscillospiraceae bacterium]